MSAADVELVRRTWEAFSRRDAEAVSDVLDQQLQWYPADEPTAGCHGREEALTFIRGAIAGGVSADLVDVRDAGDRVVLILHRHREPESGERPEPHGEVVTVRDGKVTEMVIYWTVDETLSAAGLAVT
ncbi:MAG: hypothetical protein QOE11_280 [Solirubrobacteraceae bacterium]|jgi:ketosteroid isomerase-like protein|nr:hypothetical protein [Solirubrobacteraceae bacterium]